MSTITKEEWADWKHNNVTKAFFLATEIRKEDAIAILSDSAGLDPANDNFYRGFVAAYREIPQFTIEDLEND